MKPNPPARASGAARSGQAAHEPGPFCLDIELDEEQGRVRVYDPRVFHDGRRAFARRLIEATARRPGVRRVEIDLASASCRVDFDPGPGMSQEMAQSFADSVREAAAASPRADRAGWWRPTPGWSRLTGFRTAGDISLWETQEIKPGRVQLRIRMLVGDPVPLANVANALGGTPDIRRCRVSRWSGTILVEYRPGSPVADRLTDEVEQALEAVMAAGKARGGSKALVVPSVNGEAIEVATGLKRFQYLALAGGSFALTVAALVIPGLPTVPCLLATSYYLARSSPGLDRLLRRSPFFGQILSEWEQHHGLSWPSKGKLIGMTVVIVAVTAAVTPLSPILVVVVLVILALSILGVLRLPTLAEDGRGAIRPVPLGRRALAAP